MSDQEVVYIECVPPTLTCFTGGSWSPRFCLKTIPWWRR